MASLQFQINKHPPHIKHCDIHLGWHFAEKSRIASGGGQNYPFIASQPKIEDGNRNAFILWPAVQIEGTFPKLSTLGWGWRSTCRYKGIRASGPAPPTC